jgi:hypothetical protein
MRVCGGQGDLRVDRIYTTGIDRESCMAIVWSVVGIFICGGLGGFAAWALVTSLGWVGTPGAIAAAIIGMVVAVALWTGITALLRAFGWVR